MGCGDLSIRAVVGTMACMQQYNSYPFWAARFWHGMRLGDWLALAGEARWRIHWTRWPLALGVFNFAAFNSAASWLQTLLKARAIERADWGQPPLFVVGHWRSGTTHLHDLLHLDPELACPTTYQCFLPHHFLITEWLLARLLWFLVPAKRPMDNVVAGWGAPSRGRIRVVQPGPTVALSMARVSWGRPERSRVSGFRRARAVDLGALGRRTPAVRAQSGVETPGATSGVQVAHAHRGVSHIWRSCSPARGSFT